MNSSSRHFLLSLSLAVASLVAQASGEESSLGLFDDRSDIGRLATPSEAIFDKATGRYRLVAGGQNMWFDHDDFHFLWKRAQGNVAIEAEILLAASAGDPHRKACVVIRQSLDADSVYVDAALHGDGLCSLQFRDAQGASTHEIQTSVSRPQRIRLEKCDDMFVMAIGASAESMQPSGAMVRIAFREPFFIGLGMCAHDAARSESATFENVSVEQSTNAKATSAFSSTLETIAIGSTDRRIVFTTPRHIEAPNWTRDGKELIYNSEGLLYRVALAAGEAPQWIPTGGLRRLNNDHGISPDGATLAISDQTRDGKSRIFTVPLAGGDPKLITEQAPSYWHSWSPDGQTLAYCAQRNGEFDVYTIPAQGGAERRLTTSPGLDDGPDYSADGHWIYFNSLRDGSMQIWRITADGADEQSVIADEYNNWFPHPSPNGQWIAFLSYDKNVEGHPANQNVLLRVMSVNSGEIRVLAKLWGGQGTINVPSWSPDSRNIAFVSYQPKLTP